MRRENDDLRDVAIRENKIKEQGEEELGVKVWAGLREYQGHGQGVPSEASSPESRRSPVALTLSQIPRKKPVHSTAQDTID